jgi:hypothetical protein
MKCPKCNKEMNVMLFGEPHTFDDRDILEVVGHCECCDHDATWWMEVDSQGILREYDLKTYYVG